MVITISREYGAYGRSVARALSQRLGVEYYDVDFIRMTAKKSGYSEEDVQREGESLSQGSRFINAFLSTSAYNSSYDEIFLAQKEVILELAKKPCIMVGRCSNIILREAGVKTFDVFLHADHAFRRAHALELNEYGKADVDKYIELKNFGADRAVLNPDPKNVKELAEKEEKLKKQKEKKLEEKKLEEKKLGDKTLGGLLPN